MLVLDKGCFEAWHCGKQNKSFFQLEFQFAEKDGEKLYITHKKNHAVLVRVEQRCTKKDLIDALQSVVDDLTKGL